MEPSERIRQLERIVYNERAEMELMRKAKMRLETQNSALREAFKAIEDMVDAYGPFSGGRIKDFLQSFRQAEEGGGIQIEGIATPVEEAAGGLF